MSAPIDGVQRVAVSRVLADDTVEPGGSAQLFVLGDEWGLADFRDPDGEPWPLPPGARFDVEFMLPYPLPGTLQLLPWRQRLLVRLVSWLRR